MAQDVLRQPSCNGQRLTKVNSVLVLGRYMARMKLDIETRSGALSSSRLRNVFIRW